MAKARAPPRPKTCSFFGTSAISGSIRVASWPIQSGAISWSIASLAEATARTPKASPQPINPWSVVTLTSNESAAGRSLSPQAEASDVFPALNGIRSGMGSTRVMIIFWVLPRAAHQVTGRRKRDLCVLMTRIVVRVMIFETQRADSRDLRDVFAGLRPMEMPGLAGQHDDAAGRIGLHLVAVERLAESDVEDAGHNRVDAILRMLVRHQFRAVRHLHSDHVGTRFGGMADHDRQAGPRRKRREGLPVDIFRQDRSEIGLIRLMFGGHGLSPFLTMANPRSLDPLRVQCDRGVQSLGHRAILLGFARDTRESGIVEIRHLSTQAFDGAVEHNDLHLLIPLDLLAYLVHLRYPLRTENVDRRNVEGDAPV